VEGQSSIIPCARITPFVDAATASVTSELHAAMDQRALELREIFAAKRGYKEA